MADTVINGVQVPFLPAGGIEGLKERPAPGGVRDGAFDAILQKELKDLKFSKHAQDRIASRNIQLSPDDVAALGAAVAKAGDKGGKDSLVLLRDMAFIVNVPNRTVVTAMDAGQMKENVFTNIDSAVIAE
ncbi:MAG TPA: TIGR02530 family flagellar biosynthesis protein [Bacteroidota bacterium]|nr:TIGR02530 family flagellar biosynthesis protein [Bacteroidota bacterium]